MQWVASLPLLRFMGVTVCPRKIMGTRYLGDCEKEPQIPSYKEKEDEPLELKKARLLYQSRKRGMLENDLLLSTFAAKYLNKMSAKETKQYDRLINLPSNDWDIFYWATGVKPVPSEFDNEVMKLFQEHVRNKDRESRIRQPDLNEK